MLCPDNSEIHNNLCMAYLLAKDFERGWEEYEWRLKTIKLPPLTKAQWDGSSLEGKSILVYAEQGYGDTLQFVRYLPELSEKFGAKKVAKWGDWQVRYNYAMLGKDSVLDILPDSDRYGGKTGMRAHEIMIDWGLGPNTWIGFDFYNAWKIPGNFPSSSNRTAPTWVYQFGWNMKF